MHNIEELDNRLKVLENRFSEFGYDMSNVVQSEFKKKLKVMPQSETLFGMFTALCIDTIDPLKQGRVRFYSPYLHTNDTEIKSLPWAYPVSSCGGFDDCGQTWVPPAGSTLCIVFEHGSRQMPFYLGTTWHRDRGPDGQHNWGFNIDEYYQIHEGHRKGFLVGANDGSQVFPPWNTESENGFDYDSITDFENNPDAIRKITFPNIYGWKTPQKHMAKWVDGDYKCNHKFKRMEWLSSCGNGMIFKDDWLHNSGTWSHPSCGVSGPELDCLDSDGKPTEITDCSGKTSNSTILGGHPSTPSGTKYGLNSNQGSNPYFKNENECRPYKGPGTPQNNRYQLPQSGIQFLTRSGQTFIADDSVEEPRGTPEWESSLEAFDFGCNDKFLGGIKIITATGHLFHMSDVEKDSQLRGDGNGILMLTANGNKFQLNDHTTGSSGCPGCPPNLAGANRGVLIQSTSNHIFEMIDEENEQCSPCRKEGGQPIAKAKKARIRMRTGYGLEFLMKDDSSQEETQSQYIQITAPQTDNTDRGAHLMRFQEKADGPGLVFLKVGGNYVCSTYDVHYTLVGDKDKNPADKIVVVSKDYIEETENDYVNLAKNQIFLADDYIMLLAGKELPGACLDKDGKPEACPCPVLCMNGKGNIVISDRVFVSASETAQCANVEQLLPFVKC